ncbi:FUSC family protein [Streptomyces sp. WMMC905]|uniref:FUSC family protein n=1 Tax=Streptomyces sp. WMMC905 TaxID=3404123 RepID=UPI003B95AF0C
MPRQPSLGRTPPDWLVRSLRSEHARVDRARVLRAAVALPLPLAVGLLVDRPDYGALASIGALLGVMSDTANAYRMRVLGIAVPQVLGAVGITLGSLVSGQGWISVVCLTAVALVSGMISTVGALASASGLFLLLFAVVGEDLPMPRPWWAPPCLVLLGGLVVLVLGLLAWPLRAGVPERRAVADTYRAAADLLEAGGARGTDPPTGYETARRATTRALDDAYDAVLARRTRVQSCNQELARLLAELNAVIPLVEAASARRLSDEPLPAAVPAAVRRLASAVESGRAPSTPPALPPPTDRTGRAVDLALRHATDVVSAPLVDPRGLEDRLGRPAALRVRAVRAARGVVLSPAARRYGLRLALSIALAQALVSLVPVPRSYWVAVTIAFVLKPDFGPVFSRALLRAVGTVAGLVVSAAVLAEVPRGWWDVVVLLVVGGLVPASTPRGYGYQTAAITPVILILSDILSGEGTALLLPRLVDSLLGCAIALLATYLLWPERWSTRVGDRLAEAVASAARYVECAFGGCDDRAAEARARRALYRDLAAIGTEVRRAQAEPPPTGRHAAAWWPLVVAVERVVDTTTAASVQVRHGADAPARAEVEEVTRELWGLSRGLRASEVLVGVDARFDGPPESVLEPVRREVAAARAVASPR